MQAINKMPRFMMPDDDGVETLEDWKHRVLCEIIVAEGGGTDPAWTPIQMRQARRYAERL